MIRQFFLAPLFATIAIAGLVFTSANAAPVSYTLPEETAAFKPGPNLEVVQNNCTACHSADYTARAEIQERLLAGRSDEDDQGLRRADR